MMLQDIRNEQPWVHVSASCDNTQAVYYAAAALGGLQVACTLTRALFQS